MCVGVCPADSSEHVARLGKSGLDFSMPDFSSQHLLLFAADFYPSSDQTAYGISLLDQER